MTLASAFAVASSRTQSGQFAAILTDFHNGLLGKGIPEHLAKLARRIESPEPEPRGRRLALVVDTDPTSRAFASVLLEESGLVVVECSSAEEALRVLQHRGPDVVFVFIDRRLAGPSDGLDLATVAPSSWPAVRIVLTTDEEIPSVPEGVVTLVKPWSGLDVLVEATRALAFVDAS